MIRTPECESAGSNDVEASPGGFVGTSGRQLSALSVEIRRHPAETDSSFEPIDTAVDDIAPVLREIAPFVAESRP